MSSGLERLGQVEPPPPVRAQTPWDGVAVDKQQVAVLCGGLHCTKVNRQRLRLLKAGTYPQQLFAEGSPFLGTTVRWADGAWQWSVANAGASDVPHIRRLISLIGTNQAALERLVRADHDRVRYFAREWGFL